MENIKEIVCGSEVIPQEEELTNSLEKLLKANDILTCGGGYFPLFENIANVSTQRDGCILPTEQYSVLLFNEEGNAVIYSEDEEIGQAD